MIKILYDHQAFQFQRFGGVSKYFTNIIKNLPAEAMHKISVLYSDNHHLKESKLFPGLSALSNTGTLPAGQRAKQYNQAC
jgi:hypothetical protein